MIPTLERAQDFSRCLGARRTYQEVSLDERDIEALTQRDLLATEGELDLDRQTDAWQDQGYWLAALVALLVLPAFRKGVVAGLALMLIASLATPRSRRMAGSLVNLRSAGRPASGGRKREQSGEYVYPTRLAWRGRV